MATTFSLAPIPKWVILNNAGGAAGGAFLFTKSSLNPTQDKPVFQDAGGMIPYTNPIRFGLNGTAGPFYWEFDSAAPDDLYLLEAFDAQMNPLWTIPNYSPGAGGGGGANVTTYVPLQNYVGNSVFLNHIDAVANPTNTTNLVIAPSNHVGFTPDLINPIVPASQLGAVGPDIRFVKNNTAAADEINFPLFTLGSTILSGDVTPVFAVQYKCNNSPSGETLKAFQFPVCQKVQNLTGQAMTFQVWAKVLATPVTISLFTRQYFGSGGAPSTDVKTLQGNMTLSTAWTPFSIQFNVPSVAGKTLGTCGDDALYLQLEMPHGAPCDISFIKPALYLGTLQPNLDFDDYDQIETLVQSPRTGDVKTSLRSSAPLGWVPMNDGSIGSATSGATTRANQDTFQLFKTIWDGVSNTFAPTEDSAGTPIARGASAIADFSANNRLVLPLSLGRALAGAGAGAGLTPRALGEALGEETHLMTLAELVSHTHTLTNGTNIFQDSLIPPGRKGTQGSGENLVNITVDPVGGSTPFNVMQPTSFMNVFIKL